MNIKPLFLIIAFALLISVVGCQKQDATPAAKADAQEPPANGPTMELDATSELVLGTLRLEGTTDAVTPEQAAELLPLWQVIENGSLKTTAETEAVLKQIEGKMSSAQLAAIETMALSNEDMQTWMAEQDIAMPQDAAPEGEGGPGRQGGPGTLQNMSEDERAQMREQFQSMSAEERATRIAEMGEERPEGDQGTAPGPGMAGGGRADLMLAPLIELLTARAAQ